MKRNNLSSDPQQNLQLTTWLKSLLNSQQVQFEQLGNGLVYCLIMNHYYPTLIPIKKICLVPRRHADYINNMRLLSQTFSLLKWTHINFDINKIVAFVYAENMQLLNKMHQNLTKNQLNNGKISQTLSNSYGANNRNLYGQKQAKINPTAYSGLKTGAKSLNYNEKGLKNEFPQSQIASSTSLNINLTTSINMGSNSNSTTPLKSSIKPQPTVVDDIKGIVAMTDKTDRQKVNLLKNLLGIQVQQKINYEQQCQKDLLNDQSKKQSTIVIDDA